MLGLAGWGTGPGGKVPWRDGVPAMPETHDALADDLAAYLRYHAKRPHMTWRNIELSSGDCVDLERLEQSLTPHKGVRLRPRLYLGRTVCRPDVLAIRATPSFRAPPPVIYEVKASRADFWSDVRSGKWRAYRGLAAFVYFACPAGMITNDEVPDGAGLMVRRRTHWRRVIDAKPTGFAPYDGYWTRLLVKGRDRLPWEVR